jgi:hypothetical protein
MERCKGRGCLEFCLEAEQLNQLPELRRRHAIRNIRDRLRRSGGFGDGVDAVDDLRDSHVGFRSWMEGLGWPETYCVRSAESYQFE